MKQTVRSEPRLGEPQALAWVPDRELIQLAQRLNQLLDTWFEEWRSESIDAVKVSCYAAGQCSVDLSRVHTWTQMGVGADEGLWVGLTATKQNIFAETLFGNPAQKSQETAQSSLANRLISQAWTDFLVHLSSGLGLANAPISSTAPEGRLFEQWSGAAIVKLQLDTQCIFFVLSASLMQTLRSLQTLGAGGTPNLPALPKLLRPIARLEQTLAKQIIQLRVSLNGCELDLGSLEHLQLGDVVRLEHKLDQALLLKTGQGELVCHAYLGRNKNKKAIELASAN